MAMFKPPFISISLFLLLLALYAFPIEGTTRLMMLRISDNDQPATMPGPSPGAGHLSYKYAADEVENLQGRRQLMMAGANVETADEDCLCTVDKMLSEIEDEVNRLLKERRLKAKW